MCGNIKNLHNFEAAASKSEVQASALQYVRKISGYNSPSAANKAVFDEAVAEVTNMTMALLRELETNSSPKDRDVEEAKAHARAVKPFGPPV